MSFKYKFFISIYKVLENSHKILCDSFIKIIHFSIR